MKIYEEMWYTIVIDPSLVTFLTPCIDKLFHGFYTPYQGSPMDRPLAMGYREGGKLRGGLAG